MDSLTSVLKLLDVELFYLVNQRTFVAGQKTPAAKKSAKAVFEFVRDVGTKGRIIRAIRLITPIMKEVTKFQSDKVPVSEVFVSFSKLIMELPLQEHLTLKQAEFLESLLKDRWDFMYSDCIFMAYLLDPVQVSDEKFEEYSQRETGEKSRVENLLYTMALNSSAPVAVLSDVGNAPRAVVGPDEQRQRLRDHVKFLQACRTLKVENTVVYQGLKDGSFIRLELWDSRGHEWPTLAPIAKALFHLTPSSATAERSFSAMGFIHTPLRNRLLPHKLEKLTYIKMNHLVAHPDIKLEVDVVDSDVEDLMDYDFEPDRQDGEDEE